MTSSSSDRVAGLLVAAATQHVNTDLAFLDLAEEELLADGGAELARPAVPRPSDGSGPPRPRRLAPCA
jgi:hypothetical protein